MYTCEETLFCGENANKHDLCSSTSYLVSSQLVVAVITGGGGGTPLLRDRQDHCNSDLS